MFMHDRRAPVILEVGFTKPAGNLFFLGVEGEMLPDPAHFWTKGRSFSRSHFTVYTGHLPPLFTVTRMRL